MKKEIIASGKDLNEAKENARLALGATELDDVTFEILDLGSKGIFGVIGVKPAKVKASMEVAGGEAPAKRERPERRPREDRPRENNRPRRERPERRNDDAPKKKPVDRPAVIPEQDLHFEHIDAKPGDDRAFDFVNTLVADLALEGVTTELLHCDDGTRRVSIKGENASLLIGHHGETLDALQYLANLATAKRDENGERDRTRVTIDVEGYRAKREETLRALARRMADKALAKGSKVTLEPMSPYERRIIHSEIQSIEGVTTESIGSDSSRRIVIYVERPARRTSKPAPVKTESAQAEETVSAVSEDE